MGQYEQYSAHLDDQMMGPGFTDFVEAVDPEQLPGVVYADELEGNGGLDDADVLSRDEGEAGGEEWGDGDAAVGPIPGTDELDQ
jgi:hypothetical protein